MLCNASVLMLLVAVLCIYLRLLCNLFDGMVAIEGGKASPVGALYNELPDRISDTLLLVAMGYAAGCPELGWLCAVLAVLTAYIRSFGGALGLAQDFGGLLPKQRRMSVLALGLVAAVIEHYTTQSHYALFTAAAVIAIGTAITCATRTMGIAKALRERG